MRHRQPGVTSKPEELFLACCLSAFGLSLAVLLVLRELDRRISNAVRLPAPGGAR